YVDSLARPGGNATGFMLFEFSIGGKRLGLLKGNAPSVKRAGGLPDVTPSTGTSPFSPIPARAPPPRGEVNPGKMPDAPEIERDVAAFARSPNGGLIVTAGSVTLRYRELIVTLAARHRLPAVYFFRVFATGGGLMSYGPDPVDPYRRAAGYVDRILKGEEAAD